MLIAPCGKAASMVVGAIRCAHYHPTKAGCASSSFYKLAFLDKLGMNQCASLISSTITLSLSKG